MTPELEQKLCTAYPEIFFGRRRRLCGWPTAVERGIDCDDGWFNILDQLCHQIQWHVSASRERRARDLRFNRALLRAVRGDRESLIRLHTYGDSEAARARGEARVAEILVDPEPQCHIPSVACPQVVAAQVKEKFGTLRFYIDGGDDVVRGMIALAEGMSAVTCEICGNSGQVRSRPRTWIRTLCDEHDKNRSQAESS